MIACDYGTLLPGLLFWALSKACVVNSLKISPIFCLKSPRGLLVLLLFTGVEGGSSLMPNMQQHVGLDSACI